MDNINITPFNVSIKVITLGGKKLTKSIFIQIENRRFFDKSLKFIGDGIHGFIKNGTDRYLLWTQNGILRKTNLSPYYEIKSSGRRIRFEKVEWFCDLAKIENYGSYDDANGLEDIIKDIDDYDKKVAKVAKFLSQITDDMQIFL